MGTDPLGRAMLDYQRGGLCDDCRHVDGEDAWDAHVYENYFLPREEWVEVTFEVLETVEGAVLDVGCGAGQHSLWLEEHGHDVVAADVSPGAVQAARERGVDDARVMDMFDLSFPSGRFRTALLNGTQLGLAGSFAGVRQLLSDLAAVTDESGVAVVDNYDPSALDPETFFGYRADPRRGVARRGFHVEYHRRNDDGEIRREVGRTLYFLLFGPDRLADATVGTPWHLDEVLGGDPVYKAVLRKS